MSDEAVFDSLPKYDPTKFQPPAWATSPAFDFTRKNGESSKSAHSPSSGVDSGDSHKSVDDLDDHESDEEVWEDAQDELEQDNLGDSVEESTDGLVFTVAALQVCPLSPSTSIHLKYNRADI